MTLLDLGRIAYVSAAVLCVSAAPSLTTATSAPGCEELTLSQLEVRIFDGGGGCIDVDAPSECCWEAVTLHSGVRLTSPVTQCGSAPLCFDVGTCDCPGCRYDYQIAVNGILLTTSCHNATPAPTPSTTPTLTPTATSTPVQVGSDGCTQGRDGGGSAMLMLVLLPLVLLRHLATFRGGRV